MIGDHEMGPYFDDNNNRFDSRFIKWSQPDNKKTPVFFAFPDTTPT